MGIALWTTACLQGDVDVTVRDDRSGSVAVEVLANEEVQEVLGGTDIDQLITGAFAGLEGVELESVERDGQPGYRLFVPFDDYREFSDALTAGAQIGGQQVTLFSSFQLTELNQGGWQLDATVNPASGLLSGTTGDEVEELLAAAGLGEAGGGLELTVSLPGKVSTSNASSVDGGSATWRLDAPGTPTKLEMRTEPAPGLSPLLLVVLGAVAVMLVGLVLALSMSGRKYRRRRTARPRRATRRSGGAPAADPWAPRPATAPHGSSGRAEQLPALADAASLPLAEKVDAGADADDPQAPEPGWYTDPDPAGAGLRWWDGVDWTDRRRS